MKEYLLPPFHPVRKIRRPPKDLRTSKQRSPLLILRPLKGREVQAIKLIKKKDEIGIKEKSFDSKLKFSKSVTF